MPIPNTLSRKITADFRAEKKYGGRKKICDALVVRCIWYSWIVVVVYHGIDMSRRNGILCSVLSQIFKKFTDPPRIGALFPPNKQIPIVRIFKIFCTYFYTFRTPYNIIWAAYWCFFTEYHFVNYIWKQASHVFMIMQTASKDNADGKSG